MPAHFVSAFTPIDVAGTEGQIKHVSRLLAAHMTAHNLVPESALQAGRVRDLASLKMSKYFIYVLPNFKFRLTLMRMKMSQHKFPAWSVELNQLYLKKKRRYPYYSLQPRLKRRFLKL